MTIGTILLILLAFAYFMPTVMAATRGHQNTGMIFLTNLLLGWTVLGWIGALVWAATAVEKRSPNLGGGLEGLLERWSNRKPRQPNALDRFFARNAWDESVNPYRDGTSQAQEWDKEHAAT